MKKIFFLALILLSAGCRFQSAVPIEPQPIACTQEAKLCEDGSYVGRTGPNCEFAACPQSPPPTTTPPASGQNTTSGITGEILLGPTCPVERIPPDPACAPRGYQATIIVKSTYGQKEITRFTSNADGSFKVNLAAGSYLLVPVNAPVYPTGQQQTVIVENNKYTSVTINYDSGIR